MGLTNKQKAVLHVAKTKLGLDDSTYRDMLEAQAGVRSSTALDYAGFLTVMTHFEKCGFKNKHGKRGEHGQAELVHATRPGMATEGQIRKIKAVWLSLAGSYYSRGQEWRALRGFLKKRFRVEHENFLTFKTAHAVIEGLKNISRRDAEAQRMNEVRYEA